MSRIPIKVKQLKEIFVCLFRNVTVKTDIKLLAPLKIKPQCYHPSVNESYLVLMFYVPLDSENKFFKIIVNWIMYHFVVNELQHFCVYLTLSSAPHINV
jgi:hypothetical protein